MHVMFFLSAALVTFLGRFAAAQGTAGPFQIDPCQCVRCFSYPQYSLRGGFNVQTICQNLVPKACPATEIFDVPDTTLYSRYAQVSPINMEFVTLHEGDSNVVPGKVYGMLRSLCTGFTVVDESGSTTASRPSIPN